MASELLLHLSQETVVQHKAAMHFRVFAASDTHSFFACNRVYSLRQCFLVVIVAVKFEWSSQFTSSIYIDTSISRHITLWNQTSKILHFFFCKTLHSHWIIWQLQMDFGHTFLSRNTKKTGLKRRRYIIRRKPVFKKLELNYSTSETLLQCRPGESLLSVIWKPMRPAHGHPRLKML